MATMADIENQREILDRRKLAGELTALADARSDPAAATAEIQGILRRHLAEGRAEIRRRFDANPRGAGAGLACAHEMSFLIDQLILCLFDYTIERHYPPSTPTTVD